MATLPYVPTPYPGELFGHWIARIRFYVGTGAWRPILFQVGINGHLDFTTLDMFPFNPKTEAILSVLNASYEDTIINLTTFPYWHTFHSAGPHSELLPGTRNFHVLCVRKGRTTTSNLRSFGYIRWRSVETKVMFCSACVGIDMMDKGEPYLHREHQLPNIGYCNIHRIPLLSACPLCGSRPLNGATIETSLLRRNCICGFDLATTVDASVPSRARSLLIDNSIQALNASPSNWSKDQVVAWMNRKLNEMGVSARHLLIGEFLSEGRCREEPVAHHGPPFPGLYLADSLSHFRAPDFCALLAAMQISLIDVIHEFCDEPLSKSKPSGALPTLSMAKSNLVANIGRKTPLPEGKDYWVVRLKDESWLRDLAPPRRFTKVPTISNDREWIIRGLRKRAVSSKPKFRRDHGPYVRGMIRDKAWLESAIIAYPPSPNPPRNDNDDRLRLLRLRATSIEAALDRLLAAERRPKFIHETDFATVANLTIPQFRNTLKGCPDLRKKIDDINADWPRRRLVWAAGEIRSEGGSLNITNLCKKASLRMAGELLPTIRRTFREIVGAPGDPQNNR